MTQEELLLVEKTIKDVFSKSKSVTFKTKSTLDNLIKKIIDSLPEAEVESEDFSEDEVEKVKVGRIEVTKLGDKSKDLHRVVTPSDTTIGDEHSKKFHGRHQ